MSKKLFKIYLSVLISLFLFAVKDVYLSYQIKIKVFTTLEPGQKIGLNYQKKNQSKIINHIECVSNNGSVSFKIKTRKISFFELKDIEPKQIKKIQFKGFNGQTIEKNENLVFSKKMYGMPRINWYDFFVLFGISYLVFYNGIKLLFEKNKEQVKGSNIVYQRFYNIEFLRIWVMIIGVVLFHIQQQKFIGTYFDYNLSVQFFYILSGFIFIHTLNREKSVLSFIKSKYIAWMPLVLVGDLLGTLYFDQIDFHKFFSNMLFYTQTGAFTDYGYNGPAWFLTPLFWSLLLFFLFYKYNDTKIANLIVSVITIFSILNKNWLTYNLVQGRFLEGIIGVGLGVMSYNIYDNLKSKNFQIDWKYNLFELFCFTYSALLFWSWNFNKAPIVSNLIFCALIVLFCLNRGFLSKLLNKSYWCQYSKYVLSVYLTHCIPVLYALPLFYKKNHDFVVQNKFSVLIVSLVLSVLLGILFYHTVQNPVQKYFRKAKLK